MPQRINGSAIIATKTFAINDLENFPIEAIIILI